MTTLASKIAEIQAALDTLARQHKVPGAALGVMQGDEVVEFVTGVANRNTQVPVTTSTLFQIGSNTKVYTATLVMQLVDEGLIDLDAPIKKYIKDIAFKDSKALAKTTVRSLLTHTCGIEGDYFKEFGRGDDGIGLFVESLKDIGQMYEPGEMWSYCNTGWNILGHLVEEVRGESYAKVMREKLLAPIGANKTTVLMEEMLASSCAVGHVLQPGMNEPIVPPQVMMSPSHAPAGSMTTSTPAEVLRFVRMHLDGGRSRSGDRVLSAEAVKAMQQPQVKMPFIPQLGTEMGLGWMLDEWDGERVIGHGGNTIGQASFLKVLPDRRFAMTLLTNCTSGGALWGDLSRYIFDSLAGVHPKENPKAPEMPPKLDLSKYEGLYGRLGLNLEVKLDDGKLVGAITPSEEETAALAPPQMGTFTPVDKEIFLLNLGGEDVVCQFLDFDAKGRPKYMHFGARVVKRVSAASAPAAKRKAPAKKKKKAPARRKKAPAKKR